MRTALTSIQEMGPVRSQAQSKDAQQRAAVSARVL